MVKVSISGGIGSGKSRLGSLLTNLGFQVLDADLLAKNCLDLETMKNAVHKKFPELADLDGLTMRKKLAAIVFSDKLALRWLEDLIHPCVQDEIIQFTKNYPKEVVFIEVPVLAATKDYDFRVAVTAPMELRIARLKQRGLDALDIFNRISSQPTQEDFIASADFVVDGSAEDAEFEKAALQLISQINQGSHE
jgi:dephospho-CoA kinase